jgi:hypothetical protein
MALTSIPDGRRRRDAAMDDAEEDEGWAWGERDQDAGA